MKTSSMLKSHLEERQFGSRYDPLLNGVAHGLESLFPPVEPVRGGRRGESHGRMRPDPASPPDHGPALGLPGRE